MKTVGAILFTIFVLVLLALSGIGSSVVLAVLGIFPKEDDPALPARDDLEA